MKEQLDVCKQDNESKILLRFISSCEEMLITAARDLAVLTKYDIDAHFIVNLSQKCEALQTVCTSSISGIKKQEKIRELSRHLLIGIGNICYRVKQIQDKPIRYETYDKFSLKLNYWWHSLASIY